MTEWNMQLEAGGEHFQKLVDWTREISVDISPVQFIPDCYDCGAFNIQGVSAEKCCPLPANVPAPLDTSCCQYQYKKPGLIVCYKKTKPIRVSCCIMLQPRQTFRRSRYKKLEYADKMDQHRTRHNIDPLQGKILVKTQN